MTPQTPLPIARGNHALDGMVRRSTRECVERSQRVLLATSDMVDPRLQGKPLKRSDGHRAVLVERPDAEVGGS
jgi:hypothetical protein